MSSNDHAKRVAEIEAVLADYAEVFEPPKYQTWTAPVVLEPGTINWVSAGPQMAPLPSLKALKAVFEAVRGIDPQTGQIDLAAAIASLLSVT